MQTIVKIEHKEYKFTFKVFRGTWQKKRAKDFVKLMKSKGVKSWVL